MRILHTADLHLGRQFNGIPLEDDHAAVLDQIVRAVIDREADVLVIAGDIFDRASPPESAVRQFNGFLERFAHETDAALAMIAGNHDSAVRIAAMAIMPDKARVLIRGSISAEEKPLLRRDEHGYVAFSGLPFSFEYVARACFNDEAIATPQDVLAAQIASARRHVPEGARWVAIAHAFVTGASVSNSERSLTRVGGIETVSAELFVGAHYVALGHLHRPQTVGSDHVRYSGSPLAFGFDEADAQKSMCLIELDAVGRASVETIPFQPLRTVRVLRGRFADLLENKPSQAFIRVILTDEDPVIDAMKRLREVFPNACELTYDRDQRAPEIKSFNARPSSVADPLDVIADFLEAIRAERTSIEEVEVIASALHQLQKEEGTQ